MASLAETVRYLNARNRVRHPNLVGSGEALQTLEDRVQVRFAGLTFTSQFDPMVDATRGRVVAHEALAVIERNAAAVSSETLFGRNREDEEVVFLDRLCRTIHALNFGAQLPSAKQLLLNVTARHLLVVRDHGTAFEAVLKQVGLSTERLVIQMSGEHLELDVLRAAFQNFRSRGFRVALDHFGRGASNVDRLWALQPDIVRLEGAHLQAAAGDRRVRTALARFVQVARSHDAKVIIPGLDTEALVVLAREAGADWLQGRAVVALDPKSGRPGQPSQPTREARPSVRPSGSFSRVPSDDDAGSVG